MNSLAALIMLLIATLTSLAHTTAASDPPSTGLATLDRDESETTGDLSPSSSKQDDLSVLAVDRLVDRLLTARRQYECKMNNYCRSLEQGMEPISNVESHGDVTLTEDRRLPAERRRDSLGIAGRFGKRLEEMGSAGHWGEKRRDSLGIAGRFGKRDDDLGMGRRFGKRDKLGLGGRFGKRFD